jgi:hypothetical protein
MMQTPPIIFALGPVEAQSATAAGPAALAQAASTYAALITQRYKGVR